MAGETKFKDIAEKLDISEYAERIFNSNSNGELSHLWDYAILAEHADTKDMSWFRPWFISVVEDAEKTWERPESVFQHIPQILNIYLQENQARK